VYDIGDIKGWLKANIEIAKQRGIEVKNNRSSGVKR